MTARNVVLVCLDTVRKDYFDEYAPRLQARAHIDFQQCRAASSWSVPSHASMLTGELPHEHGIHTYNRDFSELTAEDTFIGGLPEHRKLGASANVWAGSSFGFDQLFDEFSDVSPDRRFPTGIDVAQFGQQSDESGLQRQLAFAKAALEHDHTLTSLANGAFVQVDNWLSQLPVPNPLDDGASVIAKEAKSQISASSEPFFMFTNFMDAHGPLSHVLGYDRSLHDAPLSWTSGTVEWPAAVANGDESKLEWYRGLYASAVNYLDTKLVELVDWIHEHTSRPTTVVVTSDHGDEMGAEWDDKRWGHVESSLSESLLHVPCLVLNSPDQLTVAETEYFSHCSLASLIPALAREEDADVTANRIAAERIGHSGQLATIREYRGTPADRSLRAVYDGERKYVWGADGSQAVYRLDESHPCWQSVVAEEFDPGKFVELFSKDLSTYDEEVNLESVSGDLDNATRSRLEDLGYV